MQLKEYLELQRQLQQLRNDAGKTPPNVLKELFGQVLYAGSECVEVRMIGSTPSFNDGDACTFSLREVGFAPVKKAKIKADDDDDEEDEDDDDWLDQHRDDFTEGFNKKQDQFCDDVCLCEDLLQAAFGDSFKLTVSLDDDGAITFESDYYDCGY